MTKSQEQMDEIAGWMSATDIDALELCMPGATFRLQRRDGKVVQPSEPRAPTKASVVTAPSLGIVELFHPIRTTPMTKVGDRVQAAQVLCLLRIGVLLLPVTSPRAGIVAAVRTSDGATVGYGTPLMDLLPL